MRRTADLLNIGVLGYQEAWQLQHGLVRERLEGRRPDALVLLEHPPIYTIGRSGRSEHWGDEATLRASRIPICHVERGGSITYHGPGQIVGYPILRLGDYCAGPKTYMRLLEEVLIRALADWGIAATRVDRLTGVWVEHGGQAKIGAMGVRIIRGVTMHGFALNVSVDLAPFTRIIPCGLGGCRVTSMAEVLGTGPGLDDVRQHLATHFAEVFGIEWREGTPPPVFAEDLELSALGLGRSS
jgi:lipoyl(octanoyl) transferase